MSIPRWLSGLRLRLRVSLRRDQLERDLDDELQFHLDHLTEEGLAEGLSPAEARRRARVRMGGLTQHKEEARALWSARWLADFLDDVRFAARSLRRSPGLALFVVVALALGLGLSATAYSMLDALVFRPYPVPESERVLTLTGTSREGPRHPWSIPEYRDLARGMRTLEGVFASGDVFGVGYAPDAETTPRVLGGMLVSGNYFDALRVRPALGRGFRPGEDDAPGRDAVVVLAHAFWKRELAADPDVIGRTVRLNGRDFTVIGVAPESFPGLFLFSRNDFFLPLAMAPLFMGGSGSEPLADRASRAFMVRGRLAPGATQADVRADLEGVVRAMAAAAPELYRGRGSAVFTRMQMRTSPDDVNWKFGAIFTVLGLAMLLVACTNVAGLLLARASTRGREIAVRLALGATRGRLVRFLLAEAAILAALGCLLGILLAYLGIHALKQFAIPADLPVSPPFRLDLRVLTAAMLFAAVSAVLCGLAPALQSVGGEGMLALRSADREPSGRTRLWARQGLVVAQVAVSLMLVTATFLMARNFAATVRQAAGFPMDRALLVSLDPTLLQYDAGRTARFYDQLVDRFVQLPQVRAVGLARTPPLSLESIERLRFVPEGHVLPPDQEHVSALSDVVDPGFATALPLRVLEGRWFTDDDRDSTPRVAVINQHLARRYWPGQSAVGRRLLLGGVGGPPVEVVGVVPTLRYSGTLESEQPFVYLPLAQNPASRLVAVVRTEGPPLATVPVLRAALRAIEPDLPIIAVRTYEDLHRYHAVEGPGVAIRMVGTMGVLAVFLAVAGLYGLVAYTVARRTREIGIRIAIGAGAGDILRLVLGRGLALVGVGIALGLVLGFALERVLHATIFPTGGVDLFSYAVVVPIMLLAASLAAWLPARRALSVAPSIALRAE